MSGFRGLYTPTPTSRSPWLQVDCLLHGLGDVAAAMALPMPAAVVTAVGMAVVAEVPQKLKLVQCGPGGCLLACSLSTCKVHASVVGPMDIVNNLHGSSAAAQHLTNVTQPSKPQLLQHHRHS